MRVRRVSSIAVTLVDVVKTFGAVRALEGASLTLHRGRVHAIVGENGAGKSTLLKIAAGSYAADFGSVSIDGVPLAKATPREAIRRGVGMVHQHFMLVPTLTALENLALGDEPTRAFGLLDLRPLRARVQALLQQLQLSLRLDAPIEELSVGERQRLEIVRVLSRGAKVVILDEPTAVLPPSEARTVLALARKLAGDGAAVALVTHRLDEVAEHADEVTVMRRGRVVAHHDVDDPAVHDVKALAREALGEEEFAAPIRIDRKNKVDRNQRGLVVERLTLSSDEHGALHEVSFAVGGGEIVGVAGVEGNGQWALELALSGMLLPARGGGRIVIDGRDVSRHDVRARRRAGLAWIPSDRHRDALVDELPVADVVRLGALSEVSRGAVVDERALALAFTEAVERFDVRPTDETLLAGKFSGGNQQKIVVARELRARPDVRSTRVLVAAQPTRGVDARAAATIRRAIVALADEGGAVVVISSDLAELRALVDRIVVLRSGRIVAELPPEADVDAIGAAMLGGASA